ncbi:response regulator [Brevundimonas sp. PAMC22021]|uniref:response regulator n=1 Tax=Brevundimonas sp. PAMC22021 TaxID=2861285 RepID=UPI001C62D666|nr:response regulator [Brevundimonas sp. PAMC22021]QYF86861.1 response regulator [Brevundimonas sp. PAMC22021]
MGQVNRALPRRPSPAPSLHGLRVLIVEDDWLLADEIAKALAREGAAVVGPAGSIDAATRLVAGEDGLHAAVLDVKLRDGDIYDLARRLDESGVRLLFVSGWDPEAAPSDLHHCARLEKPAAPAQVVQGLSPAV